MSLGMTDGKGQCNKIVINLEVKWLLFVPIDQNGFSPRFQTTVYCYLTNQSRCKIFVLTPALIGFKMNSCEVRSTPHQS